MKEGDESMNTFSFERLYTMLADKDVLEWFLTVLLNRKVTLRIKPECASPWHSIFCSPDIRTVDADGCEYDLYIGSCTLPVPQHASEEELDPENARKRLTEELYKHAHEYSGAHRELHIIQFCQGRLKNSCSNLNSFPANFLYGNSLTATDNIYFHIFVTNNSDVISNAPAEIQQVLNLVSGADIAREAYLPLAAIMASAQYQWTWIDRLRLLRKDVFARAFQNALDDDYKPQTAVVIASEAESNFEKQYCRERVRLINSFSCGDGCEVWRQVLSMELARRLEIPVRMAEQLKAGQKLSLEDFKELYHEDFP